MTDEERKKESDALQAEWERDMGAQYDLSKFPMRWFVSRRDHGRHWILQPAREDENSLILFKVVPVRAIKSDFYPDGFQHLYGQNILEGNESFTSRFSRAEMQSLVDALWEAGMRPSRR